MPNCDLSPLLSKTLENMKHLYDLIVEVQSAGTCTSGPKIFWSSYCSSDWQCTRHICLLLMTRGRNSWHKDHYNFISPLWQIHVCLARKKNRIFNQVFVTMFQGTLFILYLDMFCEILHLISTWNAQLLSMWVKSWPYEQNYGWTGFPLLILVHLVNYVFKHVLWFPNRYEIMPWSSIWC